MNRIITILVLSFLSLSCCRQKSKMVEELTVKELKTMLETDTTNVKALIFYSQTCHSCREMFSTYFKEAIDSCSNEVKFYIVSQDTNFTTPPEQYLLQLGYSGKSYYISSLPKECSDNGFFRIDNIIKYLFPEHYADIESAVGLPFTLILSRDNDIYMGTRINEEDNTEEQYPVYLTKNNLKQFLKKSRYN